jgi:hypothetical protein
MTNTKSDSGSAAVIWDRLENMGIITGSRPDNLEGCVSAIQLFPWWMMVVNNPERAHSTASHLGAILCRTKFGLSASGDRHRRAFDILTCSVPIGTPAQISDILREACFRGIASCGDSDDAVTALVALAHLEFVQGVNPGRFLELVSAIDMESESALLAALKIVGTHQIQEAVGFVTNVARNCSNRVVLITAAGILAKLGDSGRAALSRNLGGSQHSKTICKAARESLAGTFDGLDPFLANPECWMQRGAAALLIGHLVEAGAPAEPALEILLERHRAEEDADNRSVIASALAKVLRHAADPQGAKMLLLGEKLVRDGELFQAVLFSGLEITDADLSALSKVKRRVVGANRLLTSHGVLPPSLRDWLSPSIIKALQWDSWLPPKAVRSWFENAGSVPGAELAEVVNENTSTEYEGSLAVAFLRAHPEVAPVYERLRVVRMNLGHQDSFDVFSSSLAGAWTPISAEPAELRCAFGTHAGPPPAPTPRAVGRLLAVASSSLPNGSRTAMRLLSVMDENVRKITAECLATLPVGITSLNGPQCEPTQTGLGVRGLTDSGLGSPQSRPAAVACLPDEFQILFGHVPAAWQSNPMKQLNALILAAHGRSDWFGSLRKWGDKAAVKSFVDAVPAEALCRAIIAIRRGVNNGMAPIALSLAKMLPASSIPEPFQCFFLGLTEAAESEVKPEIEDDEEFDFESLL